MSENPYQPTENTGTGQGDPAIVAEIAKQAKASLMWGIIGIFCFGIILGPFAFFRGNKALKMIETHNVGHEHQGTATAGKFIGLAAIGLWVLGLILRIVLMVAGG